MPRVRRDGLLGSQVLDDGDRLPENAYRVLRDGETFRPTVPPEASPWEFTPRAVVLGLLMTVLFSAAAAYVALKFGQGIESAIPIAILSVGFSAMRSRKSSLLEHVVVVALGATAGIVVGGTVFTMPAVFILGLEEMSGFFQIFALPFLGAVLGLVFLIPFRRYFVAEMHGRLPFPEGTATTEILLAGQRGGRQALVLLYSMVLGLAADFAALAFRTWSEMFTTARIAALRFFTDDVKAVFRLNTSAAVLGLGYIVGLRYASIICAGSFLSFFVFVPLIAHLAPAAGADHETIFNGQVRHIGIGAIFTAGILSILRMSPVIAQAVRQVLAETARIFRPGAPREARIRTDQDLSMTGVVAIGAAVSVALFAYFRLVALRGLPNASGIAVAALLLSLVVSFLFAAVSAWAIAMIGTTPISGMTLTTLILSAIFLSGIGLAGPRGMLAVLLIGSVVCTALSMTGSMVTLLKVGYWLGATPRRIEIALIGGSAVASVTVTAVVLLFARTYGYAPSAAHPNPVPAAQANAMAAVIQSVMSSGNAPWFSYAIGGVIAVVVQMLGISSLAFALGMYLPLELNTPILAGAMVGWLVTRPSGDPSVDRVRNNRGTLVASGFIAGGALAGVLDALVRFLEWDVFERLRNALDYGEGWRNTAGLVVFVLLALFLLVDARRRGGGDFAGPEIRM